jgi:hypothetical protein
LRRGVRMRGGWSQLSLAQPSASVLNITGLHSGRNSPLGGVGDIQDVIWEK